MYIITKYKRTTRLVILCPKNNKKLKFFIMFLEKFNIFFGKHIFDFEYQYLLIE